MYHMGRSMPRRAGALLAAAGLSAVAAACGGGGKQAGVAHLGTTTTDRNVAAASTGSTPAFYGALVAQLGKFAQCIWSHGIGEFPGPAVSKNTIRVVLPANFKGSTKFRVASRACRKYAPTSQAITPAEQADYLKAADCMRSHGIVGFPGPQFSNGNVTFPLPRGMDTNSQQFLRAREICQNLIPRGLPYSS